MIEGVDDAKEMAHTRQACTLLGNVCLSWTHECWSFGLKCLCLEYRFVFVLTGQ